MPISDFKTLSRAEEVRTAEDAATLARALAVRSNSAVAVRAIHRALERLRGGLSEKEWQRIFDAFTPGSAARVRLILIKQSMNVH